MDKSYKTHFKTVNLIGTRTAAAACIDMFWT